MKDKTLLSNQDPVSSKVDRYTLPSEQNCPKTRADRSAWNPGPTQPTPHPEPQTHLVLKMDAQPTVQAEGPQRGALTQARRAAIWRLQNGLQIPPAEQDSSGRALAEQPAREARTPWPGVPGRYSTVGRPEKPAPPPSARPPAEWQNHSSSRALPPGPRTELCWLMPPIPPPAPPAASAWGPPAR